MDTSAITLAERTIHRPSEPRHFMALSPVAGQVSIRLKDAVLAESASAVRLMEVGQRMYDPMIYLPRNDVAVALQKTDRESHCPLKGDCSWYSVAMDGGTDIAWSYEAPFDFAAEIAGLVAFDPARVTVVESPK